MPAVDTQTLLSEANCYQCYGSTSTGQLLRLALMQRILLILDPMAATDSQSLIEYSKCFNCYAGLSVADMIELALIDQIAQNVAAIVLPAGTGNSMVGDPDPEGLVAAPEGSVYYARTSDSFWEKSHGGATNTGWKQLI